MIWLATNIFGVLLSRHYVYRAVCQWPSGLLRVLSRLPASWGYLPLLLLTCPIGTCSRRWCEQDKPANIDRNRYLDIYELSFFRFIFFRVYLFLQVYLFIAGLSFLRVFLFLRRLSITYSVDVHCQWWYIEATTH